MSDNIVQLELSLCEFEGPGHIVSEVQLRAADSVRIKLVVRIFDIRGMLTNHVRHMRVLRIRTKAFARWLPSDFSKKPFWVRWAVDRRRARAIEEDKEARQKLLDLVLSVLRETTKNGGPIGIEEHPGAPFRLVRHRELYELLEIAYRAKSVWVFVFEPNELLSDENTLLTCTF